MKLERDWKDKSEHRRSPGRVYRGSCQFGRHVFVVNIPHRCFCESCQRGLDPGVEHEWLSEASQELLSAKKDPSFTEFKAA